MGRRLDIFRVLAVFFIFLTLSACASSRSMVIDDSAFFQEADLEGLLELLDRRYKKLSSLKALVRVEAKSPGGGGKFTGAMSFKRPDLLRLKGFGPLGRTLFDLAARHEDIRLYLPGQKRLLTDQAELSSVLGLDGLALHVGDFLEVLGAGSGVYLDSAYMPALEKGEKEYILYLFFPQGNRAFIYKKLWFERRHFRLMKEEVFDPTGRKRLTLYFEGYEEIDGAWQPKKVWAESEDGHSLEVFYQEIILNPELKREDFYLDSEAPLGEPS